jgi:hypothetical protein
MVSGFSGSGVVAETSTVEVSDNSVTKTKTKTINFSKTITKIKTEMK